MTPGRQYIYQNTRSHNEIWLPAGGRRSRRFSAKNEINRRSRWLPDGRSRCWPDGRRRWPAGVDDGHRRAGVRGSWRREDGVERGARRNGDGMWCGSSSSWSVILVGLIFCFTKPKWQTLGDSFLFNLAYILATCQITRFAKLILANFWRCSTPTHILTQKEKCQPTLKISKKQEPQRGFELGSHLKDQTSRPYHYNLVLLKIDGKEDKSI